MGFLVDYRVLFFYQNHNQGLEMVLKDTFEEVLIFYLKYCLDYILFYNYFHCLHTEKIIFRPSF